MEKTEKKNLYKALQAFQKIKKPLEKKSTNPFFKSNYCSLDAIQTAIKPWLEETGLIVIQGMNESGFVKTEVVHVETGESIYCFFPLKTVKEDAQGYGSAMSYAKRYSISGILDLNIGGEDDDGNKASHSGNPDVKEKPKATKEQFDSVITRLKAGEDVYQKALDTFSFTPQQEAEIKKAKQAQVHTV